MDSDCNTRLTAQCGQLATKGCEVKSGGRVCHVAKGGRKLGWERTCRGRGRGFFPRHAQPETRHVSHITLTRLSLMTTRRHPTSSTRTMPSQSPLGRCFRLIGTYNQFFMPRSQGCIETRHCHVAHFRALLVRAARLLSVLAVASLFFFSFLFFSSSFISCHPNLSAATSPSPSPSPPPPLALTQAIPHRRHVIPWGHSNHPLHPSSHGLWAHKSHPTAVALTVPGAPTKETSDKSFPFFFPSSLTVQDTSPSRACRPPFCRRHNHHHFIASTTGATSPTPSSLQLVSPNSATQTGGAKGALDPTIPATH